MPRNGSGVYTPPPSNPVSPGTIIESDWANDTISDIANALSSSVATDGQSIPTANLPMGGFHHLNTSDPTLRNQYATLGMVQDGRQTRVEITGGVNDLIGTLVGGSTAYVAGSTITFFAPATNTGSMTLNYNGIGARSLTRDDGTPLSAGQIPSGSFVYAIYTGTEFRLVSSIDAATSSDLFNLSITGQVRPPSDIYPALTIATATTVNVPAGSAWIVPPGNDADEAQLVSWAAQTIAMQFLSSSFTTFIVVDFTGVIQQIPGRATGANFRNFAILGVVEHITGTVNNVITRPSVFGDDGYRGRDAASLLANTVINGALVTPNSVSTLQLDVGQGTIFIPGGTANTVDSPNTFNVPPQANITFRPLAGQNTLSAPTGNVPVGSYDANGAGVVAALPNPGDATIHRLFYIYGQYVLAYGQQVYTSVENALSFIAWDRTKFKKSLYLADATLMAEIIAIRTATNLNLIAQGAVVCPGGLNFSIGSPGGIAEAPIDGFFYGRRNAAWAQVLGATSPSINISASITGTQPRLTEVVSPASSAGTSGLEVFNAANKWFGLETVFPDDKLYIRSYNPGTGALRFTTTYDLATGAWTFPAPISGTAATFSGALSSGAASVNGNLTIVGTGRRVLGDFGNGVPSNRLSFQSNTAPNSVTHLSALPSGTALGSNVLLYQSLDPDNSAFAQVGFDATRMIVASAIAGTGIYQPMNFLTSGITRLTIAVDGTISTQNNLLLNGVGQRITGDLNGSPIANRLIFQTTNANSTSQVSVIPNGTGTNAGFIGFSNSNPVNTHYALFAVNAGGTIIDSGVVGAGTFQPIFFNTSGLERMRVAVNGTVTVGPIGPATNGIFRVRNAAGQFSIASDALDNGGSVFNHAVWFAAGTIVGSVSSNATTTTYATTSDYRLKTVDGPLVGSGRFIDDLRPVMGTWKVDGSKFVGMIAHQVQEVSPSSVLGAKDGEEMQQMDYSSPEIIANIIAELQSLRKRLAKLEG